MSEKERRVFDRPMERSVVGEHQRSDVVLPVQGVFTHHPAEVLGDRLVGNFGLAVALWVVGCGGGVLDV